MLLDTHVLLWLLLDDERLGPRAREQISSAPRVMVSAASLWEVAIKRELGRLQAPADLPELIDRAGLAWLPIAPEHAWAIGAVRGLPHRDPFDRLLLAQSLTERLPLLTADRALLGADVPEVTVVDAHR